MQRHEHRMIAKALEIEAGEYHAMGMADAKRAVRMAAKDLRRITDGSAPTLAKAFGWAKIDPETWCIVPVDP